MTIALTMRTHDRSAGFAFACVDPIPANTRRNYLGDTLTNLSRSGVLAAPSLTDFIVSGDTGDTPAFFAAHVPAEYLASPKFRITLATERLSSNLNAARALEMGASAESHPDWVLFCEDDIDVCDDLIEGIAAWLERWQREDVRLYTFGSAAARPDAAPGLGLLAVPSFFGTVCYAMRHDDARSMATYIYEHPCYTGGQFAGTGRGVPVCHDLHFHQWHAAFYPDVARIGFSNPAFVQHIGADSGISTRTTNWTCPSWPGREWRYRGAEHQ